jgi:hypothetical protein
MTGHGAAIAQRLPQLYRDGERVTGVLDVVGLQVEYLDEEARRVQRRHWFDTSPDFDDAARIGALLDIAPEDWQSLGEYRAWFHALRTARMRYGAVTPAAFTAFVTAYVEAFEVADGVDVVAPLPALADPSTTAAATATTADDGWGSEPTAFGHALVENPDRPRHLVLGDAPGAVPLHRQVVANRGLDPAPLSWVATGTAGGPEYVPVVANLTNGTAVAWLGAIEPGRRLFVRAEAPEAPATGPAMLVADLEGVDVSSRLRTVERFEPGSPWTPAEATNPARALVLEPGANDLWFLPVAHFDEPGLDRVLLALADLDLRQGTFGETSFDHSLFFMDPAAVIHLQWVEAAPAEVLVDLAAGTMTSPAGSLDRALEDRGQLATSLDQGIDRLSAVGVATSVRLRPLVTSNRQRDRLRLVMPITHDEVGSIGVDRLPDAGGVYGVTDFDDSTYR